MDSLHAAELGKLPLDICLTGFPREVRNKEGLSTADCVAGSISGLRGPRFLRHLLGWKMVHDLSAGLLSTKFASAPAAAAFAVAAAF